MPWKDRIREVGLNMEQEKMWHDDLPQLTEQTRNHADNFNGIYEKLLSNTKHNKEEISKKANLEHTHTKLEVTDFEHNHDNMYYTEEEVDGLLAEKPSRALATQESDGLLGSVDKTKLDGIATGANNYEHPVNSGNKHIPAGGTAGQILRWSADGTAVWGDESGTGGSGNIGGGEFTEIDEEIISEKIEKHNENETAHEDIRAEIQRVESDSQKQINVLESIAYTTQESYFAQDETVLDFATKNSNSTKFVIAGITPPRDLPVSAEGWVSVITDVPSSGRKRVVFKPYLGGQYEYYREMYGEQSGDK